MRKLVVVLASILFAGPASAKPMDWHGTLLLDIAAMPSWIEQGSGVATVNNSSGGNHLSSLRIAGGITGTGTVPMTDPNVTVTIKSIVITGTLRTGTFTGISGVPPLGGGKLPVGGFTRMCLFTDNCAQNLPLFNTVNGGNTGIGAGGVLTIGALGTIRISIECAPWTLATVNGVNQTRGGEFVTLSKAGFVHGAGSTASSTAVTSGLIQLISPQQVSTEGIAGNNTNMALFATLTMHFIPEPGLLLLLGSGAMGLALLGRGRMNR